MTKIVMNVCAIVAVLGVGLYVLAVVLVDIPLEIAGLILVGLSLVALTAIGCWIVRRGVREQIGVNADAVGEAVRSALADDRAKVILAVREEITGEIMQDMLDRAIGRARAYGMVTERRLQAVGSNGNITHLHRRGD